MLAGGIDHGAPNLSNYQEALTRLRDYRDISIIVLPGRHWIEGGDNAIIEAAVTHAEFMKNRLVIVDPPNPVGANKLETPKDVKDLGAPTSPYTALYYPWLEVANPHYDPDTAANKPKTFALPPSAFAAGMWARIDGARGVWKAPAGLEATVRGSIGPNVLIGNDLQDNLNEWGVNCLRAIIGPTVIWGARTLATKTQPEFRYVPVRRTQSMIGESLYLALQAVVFEPNDYRLWGSLRASTTDFMDGLHRAGAFQGEKASDAYFVRCGLGSTMTQADIDAGIVRLVVGFAPLKPAEFVIVQIKQIVGRAA
jgi:phage tail sheath protein FI